MKFIKLPRYRIFDYKPRFYNPDQEKREALRGNSTPSGNIKAAFSEARGRRSNAEKSYNFRIISIIAVLAFLIYMILMY